MNLIKILYLVCMLKSVLDNSGSRQGQETANPTCHEAMRVQLNEQVFTNIREYGSTLYVGLAHACPPTNTKFKPLLLPTQTGMPYTNTHNHRTSYFKSTLHLWVQLSAGSAFPQLDKNDKF